MARVRLEIDIGAGRQADLVADDLEEPGRIIGDGIGMAVARIRVDRVQDGRTVPTAAFSSTEPPPVSVISDGPSSNRSLTVSVITSE